MLTLSIVYFVSCSGNQGGFLSTGYEIRNSKASWNAKHRYFHLKGARYHIQLTKILVNNSGGSIGDHHFSMATRAPKCCELISLYFSRRVSDVSWLRYAKMGYRPNLKTIISLDNSEARSALSKRPISTEWIERIQIYVLASLCSCILGRKLLKWRLLTGQWCTRGTQWWHYTAGLHVRTSSKITIWWCSTEKRMRKHMPTQSWEEIVGICSRFLVHKLILQDSCLLSLFSVPYGLKSQLISDQKSPVLLSIKLGYLLMPVQIVSYKLFFPFSSWMHRTVQLV